MNKEYDTIKTCDEEPPIGRGQDWKKKGYALLVVFIALVLGLAFYAGQYPGAASPRFLHNSVDYLSISSNLTTASDDPSIHSVMNRNPVSMNSNRTTVFNDCNEDDKDAKRECLDGKIGQGLELVQNIVGGIESMDDALDVFVGVLDFMGRLNPAIAAGMEILKMFIGSDDSDEDSEYKKVMDRFDILEKKIEEVQRQITQFQFGVKAALCNVVVEDVINSIDRHQEAYTLIEEVTKKDKPKSLNTWENQCINGMNGHRGIFVLIGDFIGIMTKNNPNDPFKRNRIGIDCAEDYFRSLANNQSKKYHREVVVPVLSYLTKALTLLQHCPGQSERFNKRKRDISTKLVPHFKKFLKEGEDNWQSEVDMLTGTASKILSDLNQNYAFGYVYSVLKFTTSGDRSSQSQLASFGESSSDSDNGVVVTKQADGEDRMTNTFIFYRKKSNQITNGRYLYHGKTVIWQNKANDCTDNMCFKLSDNWLFPNTCEPDKCYDASHLIRLPAHRSNPQLENLLQRSDGSVMCQMKYTGAKQNLYQPVREVTYVINAIPDIASSTYYELERKDIWEGYKYNRYEYYLYYPKNKMYMENVARGKTATQSSTSHNNHYKASFAIDGSKSFSNTNKETNPWWEVDLGSPTLVHTIQIFNHKDGYKYNLKDVILELIDSNEQTVWREQYHGVFEGGHVFSVNKRGTVVKVSLKGDNRILSLVEVEVYRGM